MPADTGTWICPVCEGVNHGGRVCSTCGERLPDGFIPRDASPRPVVPAAAPKVVPAPRPPSPPPTPTPEEIFGSDPFRSRPFW